MPPDVASEEEEGDFGPPYPQDVGDDEGVGSGAAGPSRPSPTDPLERLIQELDDLASMDGPDSASERGHTHYVYARSSGGMLSTMLCNILYHMVYCMWYVFSHIKDLIQDVLHNKEFDTDNVELDHNMHYRLMRAVADGEMDILGMWREGDGVRDVRFFRVKRKVEVVLRELIADAHLEGCQHFAFKEYKNTIYTQ